jgi:hypothetical protein
VEGTCFWKFGFSGLASEKSPFKSRKTLKEVPFPYTLQIQEMQTQRGGWWIHGKKFYFRKINIKDKRRTGGSTARTFTSENEHKSLQIRQSHPTTNSYYQHHEHANRIPPKQKPKKFDL